MESKLITTIFNALSNGFSKFVGVFKKNGLIYTMIVLIAFVLTYSLIINPIRIDKMLEERLQHQYEKEQREETTKKQADEDKRIKADELITPILEQLQEKFKLDRILLFESHNSTQNIKQMPFLFYSASYEVINIDDYDVDYIGDSFQRQYTANFLGNENIMMLQHRDYLYFNDIQNYKRNKSRLIIKLKRLGINNVQIVPIRDNKQQPIMLIVICNDSEINCADVYEYLKPFLNQIGQSLIVS